MIPPIILTAIISSFLLSLLALGFTLQYITLAVPNLAYTTIAFASTYVTLTMVLMELSPYSGIPFAFILGGIISVLLYKFMAFLRDRGISLLGLMISTLVFDLTIYGFMNIYADYIAYTFGAYTRAFTLSETDFAIKGIPGILFVSMIISLSLIAIFHLILVKTKFGIAMRAVMENYSLASVEGVNVDLVLSISWFFVGGIAGIAGSLYPIWFYMDPWVGARILISVFAACVVGGLKSVYGSLTGGLIIGAVEILVTHAFSSALGPWVWAYRATIPILIACIVLLKMPEGLASFISEFKVWRKKM
ncbi:MAG: branched-chain amino acid ABC transporter permease [Candidatus Hodarchaeota archaeon]